MKKLTMRTSTVGLFAMSAVLSVGCAAGSGDDSGEAVGTSEKPIIAAIGAPIIDGCNVSQMFDINSAAAQNIGFVAVQGQNLQDMQLALYSMNSQGTWQRLDQAAQTMSSSMQSMLNQAAQASSSIYNATAANSSNSSVASQASNFAQTANNYSAAQQSSTAAASDYTTVAHSAHAANQAYNNNVALSAAGLSQFGSFGGGIGAWPGFASGSSTAATNQGEFFGSANAGSVSDVTAVDSVAHNSQASQASQQSAQNSSNVAGSSANTVSTADQQAAYASNLAQAANQNSLYQNAANAANSDVATSAASSQAFTNLSQQNMQNVRLLVNYTAAQQQSSANIFSGANQSAFSNSLFAPVLGGCGGGVIGGGVIAAPGVIGGGLP